MEISKFQELIRATVLLVPERKEYFLSRSTLYSSELRQKMVDIIEKNSQELVDFAEKRNIEIHQEKAEKLNQEFLALEQEHQAEIVEAELQLERDLALLDEIKTA